MKKLIAFCFSLLLFFVMGCEKDLLNDVTMDPTEGQDVSDDITLKRFGRSFYPEVIKLPDGFGVEGIEIGKRDEFFVSSWTAGGIYKGNLRTGKGAMLVEPNGMGLAGLSYDRRTDYLFTANGGSGLGQVFKGATGELMATYDFGEKAVNLLGPNGALINDVIVTPFAAYFTDSFNPILYKLPLGIRGELPDASEIEVIPMEGFEMTYNEAFYYIEANGIVSADLLGRKLIVNNMASGIFYLVDSKTGMAKPIDIRGKAPEELVWGDGLLLIGRWLFITQNFPNKIAVVKLSNDLTKGKWVKDITSENFIEPATIARQGKSIYACNAHFHEIYLEGIDPSTLPYEVVKVDIW